MGACRKLLDQFLKQNVKHFTGANPLLLRKSCLTRSFIKVQYYNYCLLTNRKICCHAKRFYSTVGSARELDELTFHMISDETLHVLTEYFEELGDLGYFEKDYDVEYSSGVLTINLGGSHGTYVINKQTPNKQIWLSSPSSGPKRYNFTDCDCWAYRHDGMSLHQLLSDEITQTTGQDISFTNLLYGGGSNAID